MQMVKRIKCDIISIPHFSDSGPVIAEMLRQGGIDASYNEPTDTYNQMLGGNYTCGMFGHNGAMSGTIYRTLRLYTTGDSSNAWHFSNPEFDAIVEELAVTADETKIRELEHAAMKIYLEDTARDQRAAVPQPHSQQLDVLGELAHDGDRSVHERNPHAHRLPLHA